MKQSEIILYKSSFKKDLLEIKFRNDEELLFHIYRNFEFYIKKIISYLINMHISKCKCDFLLRISKIIEEDLKINVSDSIKYFKSFNYERYFEKRFKISKLWSRSVIKDYIIGLENEDKFKYFINENTKKIRNNYAHGSLLQTNLNNYVNDRTYLFNVSILLDKIEKKVLFH